METSVCVIIPIKHHSSRVPGKNFRAFNGIPLFHVVLNAVLKSKFVTKVIVDTDSPVVKQSIQDHFCGTMISIYDRPSKLQGDTISTNALIENIISELDLKYDLFLQTHVTNPLLTVHTIDKCITSFLEKDQEGYDSLFTVKRLQTRLYTNCNKAIALNHNPDELIPTQDLEPIYEENSCVYIFKKAVFFKKHHRIGYNPYLYVMHDIESCDIDIETDFILAENLYQLTELHKNHNVLITGVNGDIGNAIAYEFKKYNWNIIGFDIDPSINRNVDVFCQCDISDADELKKSIESLRIEHLDCIVNNAAIQICKPIWETDISEWDNTMDCNVRPAFLVAKYTLEFLKKSKNPNIINIGSVHQTATSSKIAAYACSKSALVGLTKNMAIDLSQFNIRVNCISPGAIDTKMLRDGLSRGHTAFEDQFSTLSNKHLLGKVGKPHNVAEFVYYITTNSFSTGANFVLDGGASAKLSTE